MPLLFEWNPKKATGNLKKHGVSFREAASVFNDPLARIFADEDHSVEERREIIIGHSSARRVVIVSFTETANDRIRIISARRATKGEHRDYEDHGTL